jgi:hypothetical protein
VCGAHYQHGEHHAWKRKFEGMEVSEAKTLRALERRLISIVAKRRLC